VSDVANQTVIDEVLAAEDERCRAIGERDWPALGKLLRDDLIYTHLTGKSQDKKVYFEEVQSQVRRLRWIDVKVRVYGDVALLTGKIIIDDETTAERIALEAWVKENGVWQLASYQVTRISE
jgi:hypothetical protein